MLKQKFVPFHLRVDNGLYEKIKQAADLSGLGISAIVRMSLRRYNRFHRLDGGVRGAPDRETLSETRSTVLNVEIPEYLISDPATMRYAISWRLDGIRFGEEHDLIISREDEKYRKLVENQ